ncbi:uncharacterized protein BP5553_00378 [Venustampulla echinocandica]|uniref:Pentacotripeptide-repeat region of PRORP domain-containing protein n=1 Tax=Venustampulla echinocandica TaxID=2656787 RepID=A0A370TXZ6_9HELO|nr:uncharacterized protein BP5553_00378 [Venustampulla echinocandica]RDL40399.1 hypothetical protein BP5553_00378 [Venustampulla echinocandica]
MNAATPICTKCRALIRQPKSFARLPRATFISLSNTTPRTAPKSPNGFAHAEPDATDNVSTSTGSGEMPARLPLRLQGQRQRPRPIDPKPGDILESIFEEAVAPHRLAKDPQQQSTTSLEPYKNAEALRKLLSEKTAPVESWNFFVEHFGPDIWSKDKGTVGQRALPAFLHSAAKQVLRQVISAKYQHPFSSTLPTVAEVSTLYAQLGLLHGNDWADMMLNLIGEILKIRQESPRDHIREKALLSDLLGSWNVVCRRSGHVPSFTPVDSLCLDWSKLPYVSTQHTTYVYRKSGLPSLFGLLAPSFRLRHLDNVPIIAIATLALLAKESPPETTGLLDDPAFINTLRQVIGVRGYDINQLKGVNDGSNIDIVSGFAIKEWHELDLHSTKTADPPRGATHLSSPSPVYRIGIHKRIQDALGRRDVSQLDKLWIDVANLPISQSDGEPNSSGLPARHETGTLSASLCNYFILAYMTLRMPNSAINVWNHMVSSGLTPTVRTWTAMLDGCRASRDRNALETIWGKMQQSDVKPDTVCWTTRIIGLIECGRVEDGLRALDEMGRTWLSVMKSEQGKTTSGKLSPRSDIQGAAKPTTETINAVIAGLLRKRKSEAIRHVLSWSSKFDIRPDIVTYNTLLRYLIRDGRSKEVGVILQQMQKSGVEADVVTFTTIIEEIFHPSESTTPEEQRESILAILSEMEAAGVKANLHTYGKIIYQILRTPHGDFTAVTAVMERMAQQGLQPSSHIYTMLIDHYFNRETPDLDAARGLIERVRLEPGSADHIFWDRVIEGYARAGDTASAMRILGRLNSEQNVTGWVPLKTLLLALAQNQEWDVARTLVKNTIADRGGPISEDEHGKEGQHPFWRLATELGLLQAYP